ncbi:A/G-specific DNA-adenine glycosylase [Longilinea arvoryzae]|uniref:Adenine DNA glycosylase n=1 Tax=Longilinea arvoryzae TaxID=360412 RepID=A0A0S7BE06_9CHLR|nr:A/G-specific adenine glycosylase [Longilinea arvoryzae]GAP13120.1 A/G-specific DNA-adenine glycosylase [Longilinea arvoryzae]
MQTEIAERLLEWYDQHARSLPWRKRDPDPYAVWVSESMLQQTRVETVIPYYERWMARFPTLAALASAGEQDVLQAWEGLGYYSRARNLHRAARQVMERFAGRLPADRAALESLPGIGRYTAGAIASIAFGLDEPALDGNIRRVYARLFDVEVPARSPDGEKRLWDLAAKNLPAGRAGDFNQALMDLGASVCTPRSPSCRLCPLNGSCRAFALGVQEERPVLTARAPIPHYTVTAAVLHRNGSVLIARRPSRGLLGGLWEFPGGKVEAGETLPQGLAREIREELGADIEVGQPVGVYQHAFTHFRITLHAFHCRLAAGEPRPLEASELRWVTPADLGQFPMGKVDRRISKELVRPESQGDEF